MITRYLTRGVKAGVIAGIVFGIFMTVVANPFIIYADEIAHDNGEAGHSHEDEAHAHSNSSLESAIPNKIVSILSAGLWGILLGGVVFGLIFYIIEPAIPGTGTTKSYLLGIGGFITVSGAPWLVLPPVSPGAQQSLPSDTRILIYAGMMIIGAGVCLLSTRVYKRLKQSIKKPAAAVIGVLTLGLIAIPSMIAPKNTIQNSLPEDLQAGMIGIVIFSQLMLWTVLSVAHARLRPTNTTTEPSTVATEGEFIGN